MPELIRNYAIATLEFAALIILSLSCFKFKAELYKIEILIISVLLGALSISMIKLDLLYLLVPVQLLVLFSLFKFLLSEKWLYSVWVTSFGYIYYAIIQTFSALILSVLGIYSLQESTTSLFTIESNIGQAISSFIALWISVTIRVKREGYMFYFRGSVSKKYLYVFFLSAAILLFSLVCFLFYAFPFENMVAFVLITIVINGLLFIYLSRKRDSYEFISVSPVNNKRKER